MEKHITLVGILNLVYRSLTLMGAMILAAVAVGFGRLMDTLMAEGFIKPYEVPVDVLNIIPIILLIIAAISVPVSIAGIVGAIGVLRKRSWGRIVLLVVSFFNLVRIPLGTILGAYSIWVLLNDETIRYFSTAPGTPAANAAV